MQSRGKRDTCKLKRTITMISYLYMQEEDLEVPMNYDRRRVGLEAKIQLLSEALEKQKKTRDGKWRNGWVLLK